VKHRDADPERPGRKFTVLYYMNEVRDPRE
jgi:hypothetical protein